MSENDSRVDQNGNVWEKNWAGQYEQKWDMWNQQPARNDQERENQPDAYAWDGTPLYSTRDDSPSRSSTGSSDAGAALAGGMVALLFMGAGWLISEFRKPALAVAPAPSGVPASKKPALAALLGVLLSGAGQLYLGQRKKGLVYLIATLITWQIGLGWLIGILSAIDAYGTAMKLKRGVMVGPWEFGLGVDAKNAWIVCGVVILLFVLLLLFTAGSSK